MEGLWHTVHYPIQQIELLEVCGIYSCFVNLVLIIFTILSVSIDLIGYYQVSYVTMDSTFFNEKKTESKSNIN